jgi:hypothetical protein
VDLRKELATILPTNGDFRLRFESARITNAPLARYMLVAMEETKMGSSEPELVPNQDASQVNLEHILPKNASKGDWPQFTDDDRKSEVHRIGNLALLSKGPNDKIGNRPYSFKKPILARSRLELTSTVAQSPIWTKATIAARQEDLADLALKTWRP